MKLRNSATHPYVSVVEIGELGRVANEEHGSVVANKVPVAVLRVKLHRETARVSGGVGGSRLASHGGEASEYGGLLSDIGQEFGFADIGCRPVIGGEARHVNRRTGEDLKAKEPVCGS